MYDASLHTDEGRDASPSPLPLVCGKLWVRGRLGLHRCKGHGPESTPDLSDVSRLWNCSRSLLWSGVCASPPPPPRCLIVREEPWGAAGCSVSYKRGGVFASSSARRFHPSRIFLPLALLGSPLDGCSETGFLRSHTCPCFACCIVVTARSEAH